MPQPAVMHLLFSHHCRDKIVNDIIVAHCYSFQMISSDNEQSCSRSTDGIIAEMYNVLTAKGSSSGFCT